MKLNVNMVRNFLKDNNMMVKQMSIDIFNVPTTLNTILHRGSGSEESIREIADYMKVSYEELTDMTRMETSTGKVLYKEDVPLPDKRPLLTKRFLEKCVDRTDKTKVDIDKVFNAYQYFCMKEQELPMTKDFFVDSLKSYGVNIIREYGRVYVTGCKPYKEYEFASEYIPKNNSLKVDPDSLIVKIEPAEKDTVYQTMDINQKGMTVKTLKRLDPVTALKEWATELIMDGKDGIALVSLLRKIKEVNDKYGPCD